MRYEGQIYRPPCEANSLIIQATVGCPWNRCTFCGMYKDRRFRVRPLDDVLADLEAAREAYPHVPSLFLADGNTIALPTAQLLAILGHARRLFPELEHVGMYGGARYLVPGIRPGPRGAEVRGRAQGLADGRPLDRLSGPGERRRRDAAPGQEGRHCGRDDRSRPGAQGRRLPRQPLRADRARRPRTLTRPCPSHRRRHQRDRTGRRPAPHPLHPRRHASLAPASPRRLRRGRPAGGTAGGPHVCSSRSKSR